LILKGNALAQLRQFEEAQTEYEAAVALAPERSEPYLGMGTLQAAQGHMEAAEPALVKAVQLDQRSVRTRLALASFYARRGDRSKAEEALTAALQIEPQNLVAKRAMGAFYVATGRTQAAEQYFAAIAKTAPTLANILVLAQYYESAGRRPEAVRVLTDLAKREDGYAEASLRLAALDEVAGNRTAAADRVRQVLKKLPRYVPALVYDAQFLFVERKYDAAMAQVSKALEIEPNQRQRMKPPAGFIRRPIVSMPRSPRSSVQFSRTPMRFRRSWSWRGSSSIAHQTARRRMHSRHLRRGRETSTQLPFLRAAIS
jgi:tetratricopeptide (TPR) repeat protein